MSKGTLIAIGALLAIGGTAFAAERSGLIGSGEASPGLLAAEVRLVPADAPAAQEAPPVEVLGAAVDCAPTGAGPEDTQQRYEEQAGQFRVIGTLSSFDAKTAVVAGPTGEVSATLAQEFDLRGDLTPGSNVDMRGTAAAGALTAEQVQSACASAGTIDCASNDDPHFQLHIDGDSFQVTGRLESLTADQVRVLGPGLIVEIQRDPGTQIEGGLTAGNPVKVEGTVLSDRQLKALTVALRCQEAAATPTPAASPSPVAGAARDGDQGDKCNRNGRGSGTRRFEVDDGEVRINRGAVLSSDSGSLTVDTPAGPVVVRVDGETEVDGSLATGAEVRIEGDLEADDSVVATQIEVLCSSSESGDEQPEGDEQEGDEGGGGGDDEGGGGDDEGGEDD